tara:strand:+ start:578 stop:1651 length:1074 start_codon:yes stop_codon:yes gene_type:complete
MNWLCSLLIILVASCKPQVSTEKTKLNFLAYTTVPSTDIQKAPFGGISGLVRVENNQYMAISDDRSEYAPARMIKLEINYADLKLTVKPLSNIFLRDNGELYKPNKIDTEAIAIKDDSFIISSEGSYRKNSRTSPFIKIFSKTGNVKDVIEFNEERYIPQKSGDMTRGVRPNLGFESLSISPSKKFLFSVTEAALRQDAPDNYYDQNIVRLMRFDLENKNKVTEYAIKLDNVFHTEDGVEYNGSNGISDILALSDREILFLERAWISKIKSQVVKIYKVKISQNATVTDIPQLPKDVRVLKKKLIYDFEISEKKPDNLEVLCFGPEINGKKTLIVASDNNFSEKQKNQFYLFEILSL